MELDNQWHKKQLKRKHEKLATDIGISYDLLMQTNWEIINHEHENGHIHSYTVKFNNTPEKLLCKIPNLTNGNQVFVSLFVDYDEDFVDYQDYEEIISHKRYYMNFYSQVFSLRQLNVLYIEDMSMLQIHKKQLYVSAIGAMESFLSDAFIDLIDENEIYFENFISNYPSFKEKKIQQHFYRIQKY